MSENLQFWTTFILALIGALAWTPTLLGFFKRGRIEGNMISRYNNLNKDKTQTMFLYKLSIFSKHKPFDIKRISCELEDLNGEKCFAAARNNRLVIFTFEKPYKLLAPGDQFLNNYVLLLADKNVVGYLCFHFDGNLDRKLKSTTLIFESFGRKSQRLCFQESRIQKEELFFDDTIWQSINMEEVKKHPALQSPEKGK